MYLIGGLTIPFLGTTLGAAMVFLMRGTIDPRRTTHFVQPPGMRFSPADHGLWCN